MHDNVRSTSTSRIKRYQNQIFFDRLCQQNWSNSVGGTDAKSRYVASLLKSRYKKINSFFWVEDGGELGGGGGGGEES